MKQSILITALLALALTACSKEEGDTVVVPNPDGAMAPAPAEMMPAPAEGDTTVIVTPPAPAEMAPAPAEGDTTVIVTPPAPADDAMAPKE